MPAVGDFLAEKAPGKTFSGGEVCVQNITIITDENTTVGVYILLAQIEFCMRLRELFADDDAVSPVIGVILMVAITVILAAVIASFVLGLGPGSAAPTANFDFDYSEDVSPTIGGTNYDGFLNVTHDGGDTIGASQLFVRGDSTNVSDRIGWTDAGGDATGSVDGGSAVVTGDNVNIGANSDYNFRIIWESDDGGSTQTLAEQSG